MEAQRIARAVIAYYEARGFACLTEFTLKTNKRPDVTCLAEDGTIIMIEIKSSVADFKADKKWQSYGEWADSLYFAVADDFPLPLLPEESQCGIIITDGFDCHEVRQAPFHKLAGARRHTVIKRLARTAMRRLVSKQQETIAI